MFFQEMEMIDRAMALDSGFARQSRRTGKANRMSNLERSFHNPLAGQRDPGGHSYGWHLWMEKKRNPASHWLSRGRNR